MVNPNHRTAVYPGTFDPPTNGHIDVVRRASLIFDRIVIAVSNNPTKTPLFSLSERLTMLKTIFASDESIEVVDFDGLLIDFVGKVGAIAIVRGLRVVSDFEYEIQLASFNSMLNKDIETVFLMAKDDNLFVSSSLIKEIAKLHGDVSSKVPPVVWEMLSKKFEK